MPVLTLILALTAVAAPPSSPPAAPSSSPSMFPRFAELHPEDNVTGVPFTFVLTEPGSAPGKYPSMQQSMFLYQGFAVGGNELLRRSFATIDSPWLRLGIGLPVTFVVNLVTDAAFALPFGAPHEGWLHEEWHRAVMSAQGIDTFDTLAVPDNQLAAALADRFYLGSSGSVIGVTDEQLAAFKERSPGDYVRMSTGPVGGAGLAVKTWIY